MGYCLKNGIILPVFVMNAGAPLTLFINTMTCDDGFTRRINIAEANTQQRRTNIQSLPAR